MDAPGWNGEPGAMPYDRDWDAPAEFEHVDPPCSDCGAEWEAGFCSSPTGKVFCWDCRVRRGFRYLFDPRDWLTIAGEILGGAA